jgi:alpha-galactosidase
VGHLWRTTGDIRDAWQGPKEWSHGLLDIIDMNADLWSEAAPNGWNDPDMLEVGNGGMTTTEYESHFSIWAMLAAPLIAGNDMAQMDAATKRILTNAEVIKVDQDTLGRQGRRVWREGALEIWVRTLQGGDRAAVLFNRGEQPAEMAVSWEQLDLPARLKADVLDLWSGKKTRGATGRVGGTVASHGVLMFRVSPAVQ